MIGSLHALDFSTLRLDGLGAVELSSAQAQQLAWDATPTGTSLFISQADFKAGIANAYSAGYRMVSAGSSAGLDVMSAADAIAWMESSTGAPLSVFAKAAVPTWLSNLVSTGHYLVKPAKRAAPVPEPQTPQAVVTVATTPSAGTELKTIQSFTQAMDTVTAMAPTLAVAKQQQAAQALVGKQVYVKKSIWPWVVFGVGVASVVGLGLYSVTRR